MNHRAPREPEVRHRGNDQREALPRVGPSCRHGPRKAGDQCRPVKKRCSDTFPEPLAPSLLSSISPFPW
eukprot:6671491-Pyramimonas_sp.AAC.1